jgi:hypothetical protein
MRGEDALDHVCHVPELHMAICHVPKEGVDLIPWSLPKGYGQPCVLIRPNYGRGEPCWDASATSSTRHVRADRGTKVRFTHYQSGRGLQWLPDVSLRVTFGPPPIQRVRRGRHQGQVALEVAEVVAATAARLTGTSHGVCPPGPVDGPWSQGTARLGADGFAPVGAAGGCSLVRTSRLTAGVFAGDHRRSGGVDLHSGPGGVPSAGGAGAGSGTRTTGSAARRTHRITLVTGDVAELITQPDGKRSARLVGWTSGVGTPQGNPKSSLQEDAGAHPRPTRGCLMITASI